MPRPIYSAMSTNDFVWELFTITRGTTQPFLLSLLSICLDNVSGFGSHVSIEPHNKVR